ncbi:hypothetical protein TNCV_1691271 [Trichonephila clavipes]|nr:hypothetical protein TNCV_1691271 [Trichonephila clavipes]
MQTVLIGDVPKILCCVPPMARVPMVRHPCPRSMNLKLIFQLPYVITATGNGPRNFEPRSSDEDYTGISLSKLSHYTNVKTYRVSRYLTSISLRYTTGFESQQDSDERL